MLTLRVLFLFFLDYACSTCKSWYCLNSVTMAEVSSEGAELKNYLIYFLYRYYF